MRIPNGDDLISRLDKDLSQILVRGLDNIDLNTGSQRRVSLDLLEGIAFEYAEASISTGRIARIRSLLKAAVDSMPDADDRTRMSIRLNLTRERTASPYELGERARKALGERNDQSARRASRERSARARQRLAKLIVVVIEDHRSSKLNRQPLATVRDLTAGHPEYIRRPILHGKIDVMVQCGRIVVLSGDRGTGKSRLSLEYIHENMSPGDEFFYIHGESKLTAARDIAAILAMRGVVTEGNSLDQLLVGLSGVLASDAAPRWVLLDNVEEESIPTLIVPRLTRSTVIITTCVSLPRFRANEVAVGALEEGESIQLVQLILPDLSGGDATIMARLLGGRPLAIAQICAFVLADSEISAVDVLHEIGSSPAEVLDIPRPMVDATLTILYRKTLDKLRREDGSSIAMEVLSIVALSGPTSTPRAMVTSVIRQGLNDENAEMAEAIALRAILQLERRYLVSRVGAELTCHPLTQSLMLGLLAADSYSIRCRMYNFLRDEIAKFPYLNPLPSGALNLSTHVLSIALEMLGAHTRGEELDTTELDDFLSVGIQAILQSGSPLIKVLDKLELEDLHLFSRSKRLWIQYQVAAWPRAWGMHTVAVERALRGKDAAGSDWLLKLDADEFLYYVDALVEEGKCGKGLEVLLADRSLFFTESGLQNPQTHPSQLGNYFVLLGRALTGIGDFKTATDCFRNAYSWFVHEGEETEWAVSGRMIALAYGVDVALMSRSPSSFVGNLTAEADKTGEVGNAIGFLDAVTAARQAQIHARGIGHLVLNQAHLMLESDAKPDSELSEMISYVFEKINRAVELYERAAMRNCAEDMVIDGLLIQGIFGLSDGAEIEKKLKALAPRAKRRGGFLMSKLYLTLDNRSYVHMYDAVSQYDKFAYLNAATWESAYWYGENMLMAIACAELQGMSRQPARLLTLQECLEVMGRGDKFERLEQALGVIGSPDEFRRSFSYFLNW